MSLEPASTKSTHIEFGNHGFEFDQYSPQIVHATRALLQERPKGLIAVLLENAAGTEAGANFIASQTATGSLATQAYARLAFIAEHQHFPEQKEFESYLPTFIEQNRVGNDKNIIRQLEDLDKVMVEFPNRLFILPESSPENEIELAFDVHGESKAGHIKALSMQRGWNGDFEKGLPLFQQAVTMLAIRSPLREERIVGSMESLLKDEDVVGVVCELGAGHTAAYHMLIRKGIPVTRAFSDKEGQTYYYDPMAIAIRKLRFFPDNSFSQQEWLQLYTQFLVYEYTLMLNDEIRKNETPMSDQELIRTFISPLNNIPAEQIEAFQLAIKKDGFPTAAEDLYDG